MTLLADLEEFIHDHRLHGVLTGDATEPTWNGYLLTVACPCGVVFERWVTQLDAELDLLLAERLNWPGCQFTWAPSRWAHRTVAGRCCYDHYSSCFYTVQPEIGP